MFLMSVRSHHLGMNFYVNFLGRLGDNGFQPKLCDFIALISANIKVRHPWKLKKNQNPGGRFGAIC